MAAELILLLRGLARQHRHWGELPQQLAERLPCPVLTLDVPGCGDVYQQTPAANIRALRQQLQQLFLRQYPQYQHSRLHLLAISLGGMLALDWAAHQPEQIASLVLINSSSALNPFYQRLLPSQYARVGRFIFSSTAAREQLIWQMTSNQALHHATVEQWTEWARLQPVRLSTVVRQLWAAACYRPGKAPACPALVLASQQDQLVIRLCSKTLASWLQAPLYCQPDAGHDLPLDAPDWLLQQLSAFYSARYTALNFEG